MSAESVSSSTGRTAPRHPFWALPGETDRWGSWADAVVAAADRAGAWILADEVYAGAERETDDRTPSFYGRYDRVIATGSTMHASLDGRRTPTRIPARIRDLLLK